MGYESHQQASIDNEVEIHNRRVTIDMRVQNTCMLNPPLTLCLI